eukprot:scaffold429_cov269-Pinguiococcus_pyrenoidosus.AAC.14
MDCSMIGTTLQFYDSRNAITQSKTTEQTSCGWAKAKANAEQPESRNQLDSRNPLKGTYSRSLRPGAWSPGKSIYSTGRTVSEPEPSLCLSPQSTGKEVRRRRRRFEDSVKRVASISHWNASRPPSPTFANLLTSEPARALIPEPTERKSPYQRAPLSGVELS